MKLVLSENVKLGFVAIVTLTAMNFWSFQMISDDQADILIFGVSLILAAVIFYNSGIFLKKGLHFKVHVLLFLFLPLLSVIGANLFHDQPMKLTLLLLRINLLWLFYFVLHILDLPAEKIIKLLIFIGGVWAFLTIVQQFTYPQVYFYTRGEGNAGLRRGGLIRLMPIGQHYGVFMLLFFFYQYLTKKKLNAWLYICLGLGGLYYYGTRQVAASAVICMLCGVMLLKGVSKWAYLFMFFIMAVLVVVVFQPSMITTYVELTTTQLDNDDYVRFRAAEFYLNDYWPHWAAKLLGNGRPHLSSSYGMEMRYITSTYGYWTSDIGIIGTFSTYGIFYVLNILWLNIKGLTLWFPFDKDKYLRLLFVYSTILLPLNIGYNHGSGICFFCLTFYLVDKALAEKKEAALKNDQEQQVFEEQLAPAPV